MAVPASANIHFKCTLLQRRTSCIEKGLAHAKHITIINIHAPKTRAPKDMRQILAELKGEMGSPIKAVGDFKTLLSEMSRENSLAIRRETKGWNHTRNHLAVTDALRTLHSVTAEYTFFPNAYERSSRINHMLGHKRSLNKFNNIEVIKSIFPTTID